MKQDFQGWDAVSEALRKWARGAEMELNPGQRASLEAMARGESGGASTGLTTVVSAAIMIEIKCSDASRGL